MLPQSDIQQYGGKAAILNHIRENVADHHIPRYVVLEHGQPVASIKRYFDALRKPVMARSSSPYEYENFEGIFHSDHGIRDYASLEVAVGNVRRSATSERAQTYATQHGFSIDEQMHVIVQEQSRSKFQGAMMRHPNNPDLLCITLYDAKPYREANVHDGCERILYNTRTKQREGREAFLPTDNKVDCDALTLSVAEELAERYRALESLDAIASGYALFVEFGWNPYALYQVRPFKPFAIADFDLPSVKHEKPLIRTDFPFGITPPDGIVLPVLRTIGRPEALTMSIQWRNAREEGKAREWDPGFKGTKSYSMEDNRLH